MLTQNITQTDSFTKQNSAEYSYGIVLVGLLDYFFYYQFTKTQAWVV